MLSQNQKSNTLNLQRIEQIRLEQNQTRKIALINQCLEEETFDAQEVVEIISQNLNNTIFITALISHAKLKAGHLVRILENTFQWMLLFPETVYAIEPLQHQNFPGNSGEYERYSCGHKNFSEVTSEIFINIIMTMDKRDQQKVLLFVNLLLEKCPSLLPPDKLYSFAEKIMGWYLTARLESSKKTMEKALEMIVKHKNYHIPPYAKFMMSKTSGLGNNLDAALNRYPFYFAAAFGLESIFNYFYFHKDTPDLAIQHAIGLVSDREAQVAEEGEIFNYMLTSIHMLYVKPNSMILTLFLLKNMPIEENLDIACYLLNFLIRAKDPNPHLSCKENYYREKTGFQPLFWKKSISLEELILNILNVIEQEYLVASTSVAGRLRARLFGCLLCNNGGISNGCHAMIAYTLLSQGNDSESRLRALAIKAIPDISIIKSVAEKYAKEKGRDLDEMAASLFSLVRKAPENQYKFVFMKEDELLEYITSKEINDLQM